MGAAPRTFGAPAVTLRDGVTPVAPGGVYLADTQSLVIADPHVGYERELRARGYAVPSGDDAELLARVASMLARTGAVQLVVAGDLLHGPASARPTETHPSPLHALVRAIAPVPVIAVLGNHDRRAARAIESSGAQPCDQCALGPHLVDHGDDPARVHEARARALADGGRVLVGHLHPALALGDRPGTRARVPAFVSARGLLCLPALSPHARGGDVRSPTLRAQLEALAPREPLGVAVVVGERVMVLGDVFSPQGAHET